MNKVKDFFINFCKIMFSPKIKTTSRVEPTSELVSTLETIIVSDIIAPDSKEIIKKRTKKTTTKKVAVKKTPIKKTPIKKNK